MKVQLRVSGSPVRAAASAADMIGAPHRVPVLS